MRKIQVEMKDSYKLGMSEVVGLEAAMRSAFEAVQTFVSEAAYWTDADELVQTVEYKSRDGFIANKSNCGGLQIRTVVPKCEEYNFSFLNFGECDECGNAKLHPKNDHQCGYEGRECSLDSEGYNDAALRIWFKFEGIEDGELKFMLYAGGGNGDAPYFRTAHETDIFEAEFSAKTVSGVKRAALKHMKALIKKMS